jgi:glucosamine-6-phosphate deaminase
MRVVIHATPGDACAALSRFVAGVVRVQPDVTLGLPTGHTPIAFYRDLVALHRQGEVDFRRVTTFNLDEFAGIDGRDPRSFRAFMQRHLFEHVNLRPGQAHVLDGARKDWRAEVEAFEAAIAAAGGIDLLILGIGRNGHVGFNEPAAALAARTHRVRLQPITRRANAALAGGDWRRIPTHALSMGIATMLQARAIVLLATGGQKAGIVRRALDGPITTQVPASMLQLHPNVLAVLDRAAAARLT